MSGVEAVLAALAKPSPQAKVLSRTICLLALEGAALDALEEREVTFWGERRKVRTLPVGWFDRLAVAIEGGALDKMEARAIADRIISTEAPVPT